MAATDLKSIKKVHCSDSSTSKRSAKLRDQGEEPCHSKCVMLNIWTPQSPMAICKPGKGPQPFFCQWRRFRMNQWKILERGILSNKQKTKSNAPAALYLQVVNFTKYVETYSCLWTSKRCMLVHKMKTHLMLYFQNHCRAKVIKLDANHYGKWKRMSRPKGDN